MFDLNSKPKLKVDSASISSHDMSGWVTPCLQSSRYLRGYSSPFNQEVSNAFPLFHYWKHCLTEHCSRSTRILNFSSYLSGLPKLCLSLIKGIRLVNIQYVLKQVIVMLSGSGVRFLPGIYSKVSSTPAPQRIQ